jgi:hypothetical protein
MKTLTFLYKYINIFIYKNKIELIFYILYF